MALWFVSYATSPITVTIYVISIVIVNDVTLLLSMTYHFQSRLGKTDCTDIWVIKLKNQVSPSIGFRVPRLRYQRQWRSSCGRADIVMDSQALKPEFVTRRVQYTFYRASNGMPPRWF